MINQISFFIENKPGTLNETLEIIKAENIQIIASTISDTSEYGIYRVIAANPEQAYEALKKHPLMLKMNKVFAISLNNIVGTAANTISLFTREGINIEYVYSFLWQNKGILIMRTNDEEKTNQVIEKNQLVCVNETDLILK